MEFLVGMLVGINGIHPSEPKDLYRVAEVSSKKKLVVVNALTKQPKRIHTSEAKAIPFHTDLLDNEEGAPVIRTNGQVGTITRSQSEDDGTSILFTEKGNSDGMCELLWEEDLRNFYLYADYINVIEGDEDTHEIVSIYTGKKSAKNTVLNVSPPKGVCGKHVFLYGNVPAIEAGRLDNNTCILLTFPADSEPRVELLPETETVGEVNLRSFIQDPEQFSGMIKEDANGFYCFSVNGYVPKDEPHCDIVCSRVHGIRIPVNDLEDNEFVGDRVRVYVNDVEHLVDDNDYDDPLLVSHIVMNYTVEPIPTGGIHIKAGA